VNPTTEPSERVEFSQQGFFADAGVVCAIETGGSETIRGCQMDDAAVGTDLNQKFVLVVDANNAVAYRPVTLGPIVNGLRVVREGLQEAMWWW